MVTISDYPEGTEFPVTTRDVTVGVGLTGTASFNIAGEGGPTTGTGVFLIITGVTDDDEDPDKTSGRVTATIDIERGDARFEKIALYVNGTEVDSRLFGGVARVRPPRSGSCSTCRSTRRNTNTIRPLRRRP